MPWWGPSGSYICRPCARPRLYTGRIRIGTGIAHIYGRDPVDSAQAGRTLAEFSGGRFVQGLGVSHPIAAEMRGLSWEPPVGKSRAYLAAMRGELPLSTAQPEPDVPLYLAAHGPKMLGVAAELAASGSRACPKFSGCSRPSRNRAGRPPSTRSESGRGRDDRAD